MEYLNCFSYFSLVVCILTVHYKSNVLMCLQFVNQTIKSKVTVNISNTFCPSSLVWLNLGSCIVNQTTDHRSINDKPHLLRKHVRVGDGWCRNMLSPQVFDPGKERENDRHVGLASISFWTICSANDKSICTHLLSLILVSTSLHQLLQSSKGLRLRSCGNLERSLG